MGAKKKPFYRVVVANQRSPRDGRFIETIGTYNPLTNPPTVQIQADRAAYWVGVGANPSDSVARLLRQQGIIDEAGKVVYVPASEEAAPVAAVAEAEAVAETA
jgi:small subunit ribosomal protein S16